jgi:hypothetical protein
MKMTRKEVQAVHDNIHSLSKQELEIAANRLYENMQALGYQNPVNINAFGAQPFLIHLEATRVLGEMDKKEAKSAGGGVTETSNASPSNSGSSTTQKGGCLGLIMLCCLSFVIALSLALLG